MHVIYTKLARPITFGAHLRKVSRPRLAQYRVETSLGRFGLTRVGSGTLLSYPLSSKSQSRSFKPQRHDKDVGRLGPPGLLGANFPTGEKHDPASRSVPRAHTQALTTGLSTRSTVNWTDVAHALRAESIGAVESDKDTIRIYLCAGSDEMRMLLSA